MNQKSALKSFEIGLTAMHQQKKALSIQTADKSAEAFWSLLNRVMPNLFLNAE